MANLAYLDNVEHQALRVNPARGDVFGDNVNQVLVFPNEFQVLQREYPIFFRRSESGEFQAVAVLGLDQGENLYLEGDHWAARYIPAVQARGPFSMTVQKASGNPGVAEDPKVRIDLDCAAVNEEEGYPLFLPQGGFAPYLEHILGVMQTLHEGVACAPGFFQALEQLGLIEPVAVEIKVSDTKQYSVPDVYSISQEKFQQLPAEQLQQMHQSGLLALCYWVIASLDNVRALVDKKNIVEGI